MQNSIIIFIHLMAAGICVGSSIYCLLLILPALEKSCADDAFDEGPFDEKSPVYQAMDILAPTVFTCIVVMLGSGIYYLMENYTDQVNLKEGYYNILGVKMVFVMIALGLSAYQMFGLRPSIANLDLAPEKRKEVPAALKKMKFLGQVILWTVVLAVFLGVWLARF